MTETTKIDGVSGRRQAAEPMESRVELSSLIGGPFNNAIIRLARAHRMLTGRLLRRVGLRPEQGALMMHLWDKGPQRQIDLAQAFATDSASMTRAVQRLERAGFVRRGPDAGDGRVTLVEPTPASLALRAQVEQLWARLEHLTIGDLAAVEQDDLLRALRRLEENLRAELDPTTAQRP